MQANGLFSKKKAGTTLHTLYGISYFHLLRFSKTMRSLSVSFWMKTWHLKF